MVTYTYSYKLREDSVSSVTSDMRLALMDWKQEHCVSSRLCYQNNANVLSIDACDKHPSAGFLSKGPDKSFSFSSICVPHSRIIKMASSSIIGIYSLVLWKNVI